MLPSCLKVIVRDWLNANEIVLLGRERTVLVDSGYGRDKAIALTKVAEVLAGRRLDWLVNTHCHSDHMGGNAAIRSAHRCRVSIPRDEAPLIDAWDGQSLWLSYADQRCERFAFDDTVAPGDEFGWGDLHWRAIAAFGHDMAALMFFCEEAGVLISGDALWQNGFGIVLPGPDKDRRKVMFVFSLMDRRHLSVDELGGYLESVPLYADFNRLYLQLDRAALADLIVGDLERSGAVRRREGFFIAA